jgi:myo-inositol 2-dehydrogenase / D-chiro-inositol 1-dehydrogenase
MIGPVVAASGESSSMNNERVKAAIIGSQFQADTLAASFQILPHEAQVVAVCSPTPGDAENLASSYGIPRVFLNYHDMLKERDIELVVIATPNHLHSEMTIASAKAGKHVLCEKPLCTTLADADRMIDTCRREGVLLLYGEELLFTPKYVKAKELAKRGAFGRVYQVKQTQKHFGPHSEWFWNPDCSGGGALTDLGCHGIGFCHWFLDRPAIKSVYAQIGSFVHSDKTECEDDAICIIEFENGTQGVIDVSWARRGGMDDRIEVYGEGGVTFANLLMGNALPTYSEYGFSATPEPSTTGWTYPGFDNLWNYGFPQELAHFARCVRGKASPKATGEDGRTVLEILYAAYESAGQGRKIGFPHSANRTQRPIDGWLSRAGR